MSSAKELAKQGLSKRAIARQLGISRHAVDKLLAQNTPQVNQNTPPSKPLIGGYVAPLDDRRKQAGGRRFVLTSAQNNTHIHQRLYQNLLTFCRHRGAQLMISPFTYNQHAYGNNDGIYYDPIVARHLTDESVELANGLIFCGELNILPTAVDPLSGFENYNGLRSCIVPHAKVALRSVATPKHLPAKMLYTTGAVTLRNYIQKKAGQKADFHHVYGALYVEVDDHGNWFARQLVADEKGVFYDLDEKFDNGVTKCPALAISWGDIHVGRHDAEAEAIMSDMLAKLKPQYQFYHDVLDFYSRNHHGIKDKFYWAEQFVRGRDSVLEEVLAVGEFMQRMHRPYCQTVVVESNHDLALTKWLTTASADFDPVNGEFYHLANARKYQAIREGDRDFQPFKWALETYGSVPSGVRFLRTDESFMLQGVECGMHGHLGANGAKGSPQNLRRIGVKANVGHCHAATIMDGVYAAGVTASLDMDYNQGPSNWSHSHIVMYENGKRAIVTVSGGRWRDAEMTPEKKTGLIRKRGRHANLERLDILNQKGVELNHERRTQEHIEPCEGWPSQRDIEGR